MVISIIKDVDEKIYYWFINQANTSPHMIGLITPYDQYDSPNANINIYCTPLYLSTDRTADVLLELFENELILGIKSSERDNVWETYLNSPHRPKMEELIAKSFIPSYQEIKKALKQEESDDELFYFLTPKGGELWEAIFQPKWNQYLRRSGDGITRLIDCADPDVGKKLISLEYLLSFDRENVHCSIPGTEIWETITPWQVLYWKTLPVGYSVSYQSKHIEVNKSAVESKELREEIKQADEWLTDICNWYAKDYFDEWLLL